MAQAVDEKVDEKLEECLKAYNEMRSDRETAYIVFGMSADEDPKCEIKAKVAKDPNNAEYLDAFVGVLKHSGNARCGIVDWLAKLVYVFLIQTTHWL